MKLTLTLDKRNILRGQSYLRRPHTRSKERERSDIYRFAGPVTPTRRHTSPFEAAQRTDIDGEWLDERDNARTSTRCQVAESHHPSLPARDIARLLHLPNPSPIASHPPWSSLLPYLPPPPSLPSLVAFSFETSRHPSPDSFLITSEKAVRELQRHGEETLPDPRPTDGLRYFRPAEPQVHGKRDEEIITSWNRTKRGTARISAQL